MKTTRELTSNEYYRGLRKRFERRAKRLRRLGFKYHSIAEGVGGFTRTRFGKTANIPAAVLHHADNRAWYDILRHNYVR